MNENSVDSESGISYNVGTNADYVVVKMDEQAPVNDTSCRHEKLIADPLDTIGTAVMHMCANPKCGVGFYIKQNKNIT